MIGASLPKSKPGHHDNFLPNPGQGSDNQEADWLIQLMVVPLQALYGLLMCVACPLWGLVVYLCSGDKRR